MTVFVLLAAYNEEIALPILVQKFSTLFEDLNQAYRIIVYDDGSRDQTRKRAQALEAKYPVTTVWHETNQGLGRTLVDGFNTVRPLLKDEDVLVTMDCDNTHEPIYLKEALAKLGTGYDVVILSRFHKSGGQKGLSIVKTVLSMGAGLFLKLFFPIRGVWEYSCNYRVYRARALKRVMDALGDKFIELDRWGFAAAPEILIKMRMANLRITESPFVLRYDQKPTPSANRALRTIRGYFIMAYKFWGRKVELK